MIIYEVVGSGPAQRIGVLFADLNDAITYADKLQRCQLTSKDPNQPNWGQVTVQIQTRWVIEPSLETLRDRFLTEVALAGRPAEPAAAEKKHEAPPVNPNPKPKGKAA